MIKLTGRIFIKDTKKGKVWYAVVNLPKNEKGIYPQKFINTYLPERGNKKQAQLILESELEKTEQELKKLIKENKEDKNKIKDIYFIDYLYDFVESKRFDLVPIVYNTYKNYVKKIGEFFKKENTNLLLSEVKTKDINDFYTHLRSKGLKVVTTRRYACVLRPAFKKAYSEDLIEKNPYEKATVLPSNVNEQYESEYLTKDESIDFLQKIKGHQLEKLFTLTLYLGLRRSELLGIKWTHIDFENHKVLIKGSVQKMKKEFLFAENNKTLKSRDCLIMSSHVETVFKQIKAEIEENKKIFGNAYNNDYSEFVCVNEIGELYNPDYLSKQIKVIVKKHNLKDIHFHSLRHSACSLIYSETKDLILTQKLLRHVDIRTTENYIHTEDELKVKAAEIIANALNIN